MKIKSKKIIAFVMCLAVLCSAMLLPASAVKVGTYTYKNSSGSSVYNIYLWNENDQDNNNYVLYSELTQYAASSYTFGLIYGWVYGYDVSSGSWKNENYLSPTSTSIYYFDAARSLNKSFAMHTLELENFIPSEANSTVILGTYSSSKTTYYNRTFYYKASSSSALERNYYHLDHTYTFTKDWNFG